MSSHCSAQNLVLVSQGLGKSKMYYYTFVLRDLQPGRHSIKIEIDDCQIELSTYGYSQSRASGENHYE